jgi:hypothetical protein
MSEDTPRPQHESSFRAEPQKAYWITSNGALPIEVYGSAGLRHVGGTTQEYLITDQGELPKEEVHTDNPVDEMAPKKQQEDVKDSQEQSARPAILVNSGKEVKVVGEFEKKGKKYASLENGKEVPVEGIEYIGEVALEATNKSIEGQNEEPEIKATSNLGDALLSNGADEEEQPPEEDKNTDIIGDPPVKRKPDDAEKNAADETITEGIQLGTRLKRRDKPGFEIVEIKNVGGKDRYVIEQKTPDGVITARTSEYVDDMPSLVGPGKKYQIEEGKSEAKEKIAETHWLEPNIIKALRDEYLKTLEREVSVGERLSGEELENYKAVLKTSIIEKAVKDIIGLFDGSSINLKPPTEDIKRQMADMFDSAEDTTTTGEFTAEKTFKPGDHVKHRARKNGPVETGWIVQRKHEGYGGVKWVIYREFNGRRDQRFVQEEELLAEQNEPPNHTKEEAADDNDNFHFNPGQNVNVTFKRKSGVINEEWRIEKLTQEHGEVYVYYTNISEGSLEWKRIRQVGLEKILTKNEKPEEGQKENPAEDNESRFTSGQKLRRVYRNKNGEKTIEVKEEWEITGVEKKDGKDYVRYINHTRQKTGLILGDVLEKLIRDNFVRFGSMDDEEEAGSAEDTEDEDIEDPTIPAATLSPAEKKEEKKYEAWLAKKMRYSWWEKSKKELNDYWSQLDKGATEDERKRNKRKKIIIQVVGGTALGLFGWNVGVFGAAAAITTLTPQHKWRLYNRRIANKYPQQMYNAENFVKPGRYWHEGRERINSLDLPKKAKIVAMLGVSALSAVRDEALYAGEYTAREFKYLAEIGVNTSLKAAKASGVMAAKGGMFAATQARAAANKGIDQAVNIYNQSKKINPVILDEIKQLSERNKNDLIDYARRQIERMRREG